MNTIIDLLKHPGVRLKDYDTWMLWDAAQEAWVVYHQAYRKRSKKVIVTGDEEQAVTAFIRAANIQIKEGPCVSKPHQPQPGERWRDKEQPDRYIGTIQDYDKNSPGSIPIRFDGYNTVAFFQSDHFFNWLEPVPAGGQE